MGNDQVSAAEVVQIDDYRRDVTAERLAAAVRILNRLGADLDRLDRLYGQRRPEGVA